MWLYITISYDRHNNTLCQSKSRKFPLLRLDSGSSGRETNQSPSVWSCWIPVYPLSPKYFRDFSIIFDCIGHISWSSGSHVMACDIFLILFQKFFMGFFIVFFLLCFVQVFLPWFLLRFIKFFCDSPRSFFWAYLRRLFRHFYYAFCQYEFCSSSSDLSENFF